ncbi:MAG: N-acetylmuramoyl-L-alanine amidase [Desulfuromonas sp.]|nr:N-acetylmuramoyl-L-alanine amidase [Desulfuromonas sp.]
MIRIVQFLLLSCFVFICGISASYATASASVESQYTAARNAYIQLIKSPAKQKYRHNWDKVLKQLNHFTASYPTHDKAASAYYLLGKSYRQLYEISRITPDAQRAVDSFNTLATTYHTSSLADDALYLQAEIQQDILHKSAPARELCEQIISEYSHGDMVGKARLLLSKLPRDIATTRFTPPQKKLSSGKKEITAVRHQSDDKRTRVVVELSQKCEFKVNTLAPSQNGSGQIRLYFDIYGAQIGNNVSSAQNINRGPVKKIRLGRNREYTRMVCDLTELSKYNFFELNDPPRIVLDIAHSNETQLRADIPQLQAVPGAPTATTKGQQQIAALLNKVPDEQPMRVNLPDVARKQQGKLRIVVDAGHGGKDPGAVGYGNLYEKDVTLKLAKLLSARLKKHLNCEVLMTRTHDVYIPLQQRTAYANKVDADLFISIHANASTNKSAHGIETFYLNFSKNDKAVEVAARENGMSLKEVGDLELILFDLMANSKINESSRLASDIQSSLTRTLRGKYSNIKDLGVKQGPFHVLLGATMPSVLVEVAFISNKQEAKRLKSQTYQERSVDAIVDGVKSYLRSQKLLR